MSSWNTKSSSRAATPCRSGRRSRRRGSTSSCSAGTERMCPLVLSEPCNAGDRHRDPARPAQSPDRRSLAHPGRRARPTSSATATGSMGPKGVGHRFDPSHRPARPRRPAPFRAAGSGARSGNAAPAEPGEPGDGRRSRRRQSRASLARTRSSTSSTSGASPSTRRPASAMPGTFAGLIEKIPYLKAAGGDGRRAPADRRVRRERLPVRQPAHRRAAQELLGLQHDRLRRSQGRVRQQSRALGALGRVPRDGHAPSTRPGSR